MTVFPDTNSQQVCFVREYTTDVSQNFVLQQDTEKKFSEYLKEFLSETTTLIRKTRLEADKKYPSLFS